MKNRRVFIENILGLVWQAGVRGRHSSQDWRLAVVFALERRKSPGYGWRQWGRVNILELRVQTDGYEADVTNLQSRQNGEQRHLVQDLQLGERTENTPLKSFQRSKQETG